MLTFKGVSAAGMNPLRVLTAACNDMAALQSVLRAGASNIEAVNRLQTSGIRPQPDRIADSGPALENSVESPALQAAQSLASQLRAAVEQERVGGYLKFAPEIMAAADRLKQIMRGGYQQSKQLSEGLKALSDGSHEPIAVLRAALLKKGFSGSFPEQIDQIRAQFESLQRHFLHLEETDAASIVAALECVQAVAADFCEGMSLAQAIAWNGVCHFARIAFTDASRPTILPAPVAWINDPVGVHVNAQGELVIYHQLNPFAKDPHRPMHAAWDHMHYGKYVIDLKSGHSKIMPPVMAPMPSLDEDHCFSGSRHVTRDGRVGLWYTSIGPFSGFPDAAVQRVAWADDRHENWFVQDPAPTLTEEVHPEGLKIYEWRDPMLFEHGGETYMLLGGSLSPRVDQRIVHQLVEGGLACALNQHGVIALYKALNGSATAWKYMGLLLDEPQASIVECPNLIDVGDRQLLLSYVSLFGKRLSQYRLGWLHADASAFETESVGSIDYGDVFAPTVFQGPGGEPMVIGWVKVDLYRRNWNDTFPEGHGWSGCFTSPRRLELRRGKLWQTPVIPEGLHGETWKQESLRLEQSVLNAPLQGRAARLQMTLMKGDGGMAGVVVRAPEASEQEGGVRIAWDGKTLVVAERQLPMDAPEVALDVVVDNSVIEVFANGVPLTHVYDPLAGQQTIRFFADQTKAMFQNIQVTILKPAPIELSGYSGK